VPVRTGLGAADGRIDVRGLPVQAELDVVGGLYSDGRAVHEVLAGDGDGAIGRVGVIRRRQRHRARKGGGVGRSLKLVLRDAHPPHVHPDRHEEHEYQHDQADVNDGKPATIAASAMRTDSRIPRFTGPAQRRIGRGLHDVFLSWFFAPRAARWRASTSRLD
jgi:hypothetical protein